MEKHKKEKNKKEFLKLINHYYDLSRVKRNPEYIKLDKPIHYGFEIYWSVNDNLSDTEYGSEIQALIEEFGCSSWCKDKSFLRKNWKGKFSPIEPYFKTITSDQMDRYQSWVKKWFVIDYLAPIRTDWCGREIITYRLNFPKNTIVKKIRPYYLTHREILKPDLMSEISVMENIFLSNKFYGLKKKHDLGNFSDKPWAKIRNRKDRQFNKNVLRKNLNSDNEIDFRFNHKKSALRDWW